MYNDNQQTVIQYMTVCSFAIIVNCRQSTDDIRNTIYIIIYDSLFMNSNVRNRRQFANVQLSAAMRQCPKASVVTPSDLM